MAIDSQPIVHESMIGYGQGFESLHEADAPIGQHFRTPKHFRNDGYEIEETDVYRAVRIGKHFKTGYKASEVAPDLVPLSGKHYKIEGMVEDQFGDAEIIAQVEEKSGRFHRLFRRLGSVATAAHTDITESKNKLLTYSSGALLVGTQIADRARGAILIIPPVAVEVLKDTNNAPATGAAAAAIFLGCYALVGEATQQGLNQFPQTVDSFEENFPSVVDAFSKALPGFKEKDGDVKGSRIKRLAGQVVTHASRGGTAAGLGTTAYVATASAKNWSQSSIRKLYLKAAADGAAVIGLIAGGAAEAILIVKESNPLLALRIRNDVGNIKTWYAIAAASIVGTSLSNRLEQRKIRKQNEQHEQ